jgi:branched-chain amino acid transport system substrate-binding protein
MRARRSRTALALAVSSAGLLSATAAATAGPAARAAGKPIVIGAVVDLTKNMAPFDAPAIAAAQIQIKKINAAGGVLGRPLQLKVINDGLDAQKTKQGAVQQVSDGADIGWVTCDVDYATPAVQEFLNAGKLTVAPCTGTDEMSPLRFGDKGKLAFSFGNAAQDEGAAMAEYAFKQKHWASAVVVTDNLLRYFKDVCQAFTVRFQELGGKVQGKESFTQGDKTIGSVVSRVNGKKPDVVAFCTSFGGDQPAFVSGLRTLGNATPILNSWSGDGAYWWPKSPPVTGYYYVTYASVYGDDPSKDVKSFEAAMKKAGHAAQTGGFLGGASAIQGIAAAIRTTGGTDGAKLAAALERFRRHPTISGQISFSPALHSVFGRAYRVIRVEGNKGRYVGSVTASSPARIH